jgi:hypothetical protein
MMRAGKFGHPLQVQDETMSQLVTTPSKYVYTTHKMLGHYKAPAGTNQTQLQVLLTTSNGYAKLVAMSPCNCMDSWFFYTAVYLKSLGYVLSNCFFPAKALKKVQKNVLCAFLAKCG